MRISETASSPSTALRAALSGLRTASIAFSAILIGTPIASPTPRPTSSAVEGDFCGTQSSSTAAISGTGSRSKSTVPMSTPETPSTIAWWVLVRIAKRSRSNPCTSQSSQRGLERSSCCEKTRPASRFSCASPPGSGSAVWRMW